ncbi:hypothetical protein PENANT_c016G10563 [Penicillium antarcticum]|uniref:Zn(2)-C6 fungal-type domain-containing protein n=1 Tax=Penicillium antarcticum TaxID=416450 RepID=A0A1V6Q2V7_9EURO|nr:hypothetical protein PENANT_c016G10563 [Penicillium antarcticum]
MSYTVGQVSIEKASRSSAPRVRLTCEACRQRKVRCDKLSPCTSCQRLGLVCVPVERARLPRGRTRKPAERVGGSDKELSERVAKLEALLRKVATERDGSANPTATEASHASAEVRTVDPDGADHSEIPSPNIPHRPRPSTTYMGISFWEDIIQQTQELRTVLDDRLEHDNSDIKDSTGFGLSLDDKPYLDYEPDHQAPATLASAVYLAAVCTIDDAECQSLFNADKRTVIAEFQKETEGALAKADFVTTNDLAVLQAYVISLLAARSQDQSRRVWTMLSMALRVAQALSLHLVEPPFYVTPFEQEMRNRVWLGIGILDIAASLDRASEPMMQAMWIDSHPPSNINDEDIWFGMPGPVPQHPPGTFTDMTHSLVIASSSSVTRSLAFADFIEPKAVELMGQRQQAVHNYQQTVATLLSGCRPEQSDFQWYAQKLAGVMSSWLQLACLRPLYKSKTFTPPKIHGDALLKLAAENLQTSQEAYSYPGAARWRWFGSMWVPWHALAVAIAELCVCKDPSIMSQYWSVVNEVYQRSRYVIADSQQGMLWKPMERLMTQAQTRRKELQEQESASQAMSRFSFNELATGYMPQQPQAIPQSVPPPNMLGMDAAINPQTGMHMAAPPITFGNMPWANVWEAMDFNDTTFVPPNDNAWLSYENFIENVYESADSIFLPR